MRGNAICVGSKVLEEEGRERVREVDKGERPTEVCEEREKHGRQGPELQVATHPPMTYSTKSQTLPPNPKPSDKPPATCLPNANRTHSELTREQRLN